MMSRNDVRARYHTVAPRMQKRVTSACASSVLPLLARDVSIGIAINFLLIDNCKDAPGVDEMHTVH